MGIKIRSKNGEYDLNDCKDELDYQDICSLKKVLRKIINHHPSSWEILNYKIHGKSTCLEPDNTPEGGHERKVFTKISVEIELLSELLFDAQKNLIEY